ncbi:GNAT family N-acetyltransferase [Bacillus sp. FJAT-47783]|uniref:GNAT family N-acetyltransferase n=1 Tax=Bacillus sp. FJAT-47783 TaxID=2922712 RepID=UPI001FAD41C5|nr:GNAT family N-acetyltransferase [Bacillus sp. FJAT-47783]
MNTDIELKVLKSYEALQRIQKLEKLVWNISPLPIHQTITASQNGGLVLGAFLHEEIVGFSYSFPGFHKGQSYLCSHMLGIHPDHQGKGVGARLKQEQKEIAREMGYDLVVWTYDPLETRNAYLNLSKLQTICSTYVEDCYGEMGDNLNKGLPSDRFKVEWWINSTHVKNQHPIPISQTKFQFRWEKTVDGLPKLKNVEHDLKSNFDYDTSIFVPVPANIQHIKKVNHALAMDWRLKTRNIFQTLFAKGYAAVSLKKSADESVHYYLLVQKNTLKI